MTAEPLIECLACDIVAGRQVAPGGVIHEDAHWMLDHAVDPLIRGYLILKPKRHVHELADLEPDELVTLGPMLQTALAAMRRTLEPERIYVCSFAETHHHLHFHLLPRYRTMPALGPGLLPAIFTEGRWKCSPAEAEEAAAGVRAQSARDMLPRDMAPGCQPRRVGS